MFEIKYSIENGVFHVMLSDQTDHKELIDYMKLICKTPVENNKIIIITDFRNVILNETSPEPIKKIAEFVNSTMKQKFDKIKWAILSVDFMPIAGAMIFIDMIKDNRLDAKPFTTMEGVLSWLDLSPNDLNNLVSLGS